MLEKKFQKSSFRHATVGKFAQTVAVYAFGPLLQLILISIILGKPVSQKKGARLGDNMESNAVKISDRFDAKWRSESEVGNWRLFVELDPESSVVDIYEFWGNGTPGRAFDGKTILWAYPLANKSSAEELVRFLQGSEGQELLKRVVDGHEMRFDGSNYRGRLNEDSRDAEKEIEENLQELWEETPEIWSPAEWFDSGYLSDDQVVNYCADAGSIDDYASEQSTICEGVLCPGQVEKYLESVCRKVISEEKGGVVLDAYHLLGEGIPAWGKDELSPLYDKADWNEIYYVIDENGENFANALVYEIGSIFYVGYTDEMDGWKVMSREDSSLTLSLELPDGNA